MHQLERGVQLGAVTDGSMTLSHTFNAPDFTTEKKAHYDMSEVCQRREFRPSFMSKRFVNEIIMIIIKHLKKLDYQRA